ncbi:hypothetical protein GE09DRAFT_377600 [Coniochaeta sp. 2T2.1]|nr:hypothetical protein GE09DRAFT_377600 [Coniochaeta sp. 2T2.1]
MRTCFGLTLAVLAKAVACQSAVTVTAPAPSAPSPNVPPFSVSIVTAGQPEPPATLSSMTVFASPNGAPSPSAPAPSIVTVTGPPINPSSPAVPSSSSGGGSGGGSGEGGTGSGSGGSTPGGGICGLGYTYCGYILINHQGFAQSDVVKAYCAGSPDNCSGGSPKTNPLNALFICLPPTSDTTEHRLFGRIGAGKSRRQSSGSGSDGGGGGGGAAPPNGCSSTPGPGNKLHLLCSCGGQCLNPDEDHIGRCDTPCT